jgi:hypothetical protein
MASRKRKSPPRRRPAKAKAKRPARRVARQASSTKRARKAKPVKHTRAAKPKKTAPKASSVARQAPTRRPRADREVVSASDDRLISAARAGHDEIAAQLAKHTAASPKLTAGDIDADWQDAYAIGDEAPGGDNPTPDQDRVDDIGRALGVNYQDDEELRGSEKISERDRHRWELDPASSDDWPHDRRRK